MATWTFRKKKTSTRRVIFRLNFDVYSDMDNRERASARKKSHGDEFRWKKDENFCSGSEKMRDASSQRVKNERR